MAVINASTRVPACSWAIHTVFETWEQTVSLRIPSMDAGTYQ